ncbi:MAG: type II secretion system major pseudopilin GspG [Planctomycetia bacterium]
MQLRRLRARRRSGFTLLEVLLVVAILVALAAIAVPNLIGVQEGAKIDEAKLQVNALDTAFNTYSIHNKGFPTTEQGVGALLSAPNPAPPNWRGPYLKNPNLTDPWGSQYGYQYPGTRVASGPDIWSNGPDRQQGTADDVGNWPANTTR